MSKQKGLILCNGQIPPKTLIRKYLDEQTLFIAADGGGNIALEIGFVPEVIIGDLDSFDGSKLNKLINVQVIKDEDQETNDLEKALAWLLKNSAVVEVVILGATNKRLDHSLKNLSVMLQFNPQFKSLEMVDEYGRCFVLPKHFEASFEVATTVSLVPFSGKVNNIVTQGLKYPLKNESLAVGIRDGSSNEIVQERVVITHGDGDLLMYVVEGS